MQMMDTSKTHSLSQATDSVQFVDQAIPQMPLFIPPQNAGVINILPNGYGPQSQISMQHPYNSSSNIRVDSILQKSNQSSPLQGSQQPQINESVPSWHFNAMKNAGQDYQRPGGAAMQQPGSSGGFVVENQAAHRYMANKTANSFGNHHAFKDFLGNNAQLYGQQASSKLDHRGQSTTDYNFRSNSLFSGQQDAMYNPQAIQNVNFPNPSSEPTNFSKTNSRQSKLQRNLQRKQHIKGRSMQKLNQAMYAKRISSPMNQDFVMHNNNNQEFETLIRSQPNGSEENWQLLNKESDKGSDAYNKSLSQLRGHNKTMPNVLQSMSNSSKQFESHKDIHRFAQQEMFRGSQRIQSTHGSSAIQLMSANANMQRPQSYSFLNSKVEQESSQKFLESCKTMNPQLIPQLAFQRLNHHSGLSNHNVDNQDLRQHVFDKRVEAFSKDGNHKVFNKNLKLIQSRSFYNESKPQKGQNKLVSTQKNIIVRDFPRHKLLQEIERQKRNQELQKDIDIRIGILEVGGTSKMPNAKNQPQNPAQQRLQHQREDYFMVKNRRRAISNLQNSNNSFSRASQASQLFRVLGQHPSQIKFSGSSWVPYQNQGLTSDGTTPGVDAQQGRQDITADSSNAAIPVADHDALKILTNGTSPTRTPHENTHRAANDDKLKNDKQTRNLNFTQGQSLQKRKNPVKNHDRTSSVQAGTTEEDDVATFGINYSQYPETVLDKENIEHIISRNSQINSPDSVEKLNIMTHLKSFEEKQNRLAQEEEKQQDSVVKQSKGSETRSKKLDSIGEQEINHMEAYQQDYDITQNATLTNESLKQQSFMEKGEIKKLPTKEMSRSNRETGNDMLAREDSKVSNKTSSGVYETHDQMTYSRRLFSEQQNDTADGNTENTQKQLVKPEIQPITKEQDTNKVEGSFTQEFTERSMKNMNTTMGQGYLNLNQDILIKNEEEASKEIKPIKVNPNENPFLRQGQAQPTYFISPSTKDAKNGKHPGQQEVSPFMQKVDLEPYIVEHNQELSDTKAAKVADGAHQLFDYGDNEVTKSEINYEQLKMVDSKSMTNFSSQNKKANFQSKRTMIEIQKMPLMDLLQSNNDNHKSFVDYQDHDDSQKQLKRAKSYKSQKESFNAYMLSKAVSRSQSRGRPLDGTGVNGALAEDVDGGDIRQAYYMDVVSSQAFGHQQKKIREEAQTKKDDPRLFNYKMFRQKTQTVPIQMDIRQVNAIKRRTIKRDGGEFIEGSLSHLIKICPGPQDLENLEGQKKMLQEAHELKQIRKERFMHQLNESQFKEEANFINQTAPGKTWKPKDAAKMRINEVDENPTVLTPSKLDNATNSSRHRSQPRETPKNQILVSNLTNDDNQPKQKASQHTPLRLSNQQSHQRKRSFRRQSSRPMSDKSSKSKVSRSSDVSQVSYKERIAEMSRLKEASKFQIRQPKIPISQEQKIAIAKHLLDIMADIEVSGRLEEPEKKCLFVAFSRYLEKISQQDNKTDDKKKEKVLLRGKDLRVEALEKCAQKVIDFVSMPEIINESTLGFMRLFMLNHIETQAQQAINAGKIQENETKRNQEKLQILQVSRAAQLKNMCLSGSVSNEDLHKTKDDKMLQTDSDQKSFVFSDDEDNPNEMIKDSAQSGTPSNYLDSDAMLSDFGRKRQPGFKKFEGQQREKPAFILKDLSMCVLEDQSESDEEIHEHIASQRTRRNQIRGEHILKNYGINHKKHEPKYFKFNDYIYDTKTLLSKGGNETDKAHDSRTSSFVSPNRLRQVKLREQMLDTWQNTILGKVMTENPDNIIRCKRVEKYMALNKSGIKDIFMTGQQQRMTLEQEEYLIVDEIMKNCIRVAEEKDDPDSVLEIFYERYMKEINRRARTFCDREKVNMVRRVDFGETQLDESDSESHKDDSQEEEPAEAAAAGEKKAEDEEESRNAKQITFGTVEDSPVIKNQGQQQDTKRNANLAAGGSKVTSGQQPKGKSDNVKDEQTFFQSQQMLKLLKVNLEEQVKGLKKPFMMADDTRFLYDSILTNDWRHVLRLVRKDRNLVFKANEQKELPLTIAFKHEAYESAGILMKYGSPHPSCPDNVENCKEYVAALVKGHLYEADYDLASSDQDTDRDRNQINSVKSSTNEDKEGLQLAQMEAITENLDLTFERGVLEQITRIQNYDIYAVYNQRKKAEWNKNISKVVSYAYDLDLYNSQIQYIRDLIVEGKIDDYENIVRQYVDLLDGKNRKYIPPKVEEEY